MRRSSFQQVDVQISREIESQYDNVKIVADNISYVEKLADALDNGVFAGIEAELDGVLQIATEVVPHIAEILLADDKAVIATTKAAEALVSANNADASEAAADLSEANALASKQAAAASELVASTKAAEALASAQAADTSEANALSYMTDANTYRGQALTSKTDAQLSAWEAEADRMTADSYAMEAHNAFVRSYTSNGDGTFTVTVLDERSALHWATEASDVVTGGIIDDVVASGVTVYSSDKVLALHNAQAQAIANLATAQAQISNDGSTVITTSNQMLSFATVIDTTDSGVFTLDAAANTITFKQNASYNFSSVINLASSTSTTRTITFEVINTADSSVLATEQATLDVASGSDIVISTITLLTIGKVGFPDAPVTASIRVRADGTGYTITGFTSILASSSSYDLTNEAGGILFTPSGTVAATNVQAAIEEIDTQLDGVHVFRADKYLASQNIVNMIYSSGNLVKIQYNNPTDVDYEVLSYSSGALVGVAHLVGGVLKGNTILSYTNGTLISSVFTGV